MKTAIKNHLKTKPETFTSFLEKISKIVEPKIKEVLGLYVDKETEGLVYYQITSGGKRLRPALAVLSSLVCGGDMNKVLYPAAGLEILHNCTLIYDDIIDNSSLRRKKPTVWFKFGKSIAQCVGMDYSAAIFQAANKSENPTKISEIFARTMKTVVDGEILDILFEQFGRKEENYITENRYKEIDVKDYLKMIGKKTAVLIQASCEVGAISANASKSEKDALSEYGFNLGIAFQIKDDILDIFGKEEQSGKKIGTDIRERKLGNIVLFYAQRDMTIAKNEKVLAVLRKERIRDEDIAEVIKIIHTTNAKEKAFLLGEKYIQRAKECLKHLPKNEWNKFLEDIADFVMAREV